MQTPFQPDLTVVYRAEDEAPFVNWAVSGYRLPTSCRESYPHSWSNNRVRPYGVVRTGDWKLIELYEDMRVGLYNLKKEISEAHDLAQEKPEKTAELRTPLHGWHRSVDAQMPTRNPDFKR